MTATIVVGVRGAGKSRWIAEEMTEAGRAGILSEKVIEGRRAIGYDLRFLPGTKREPVARSAASFEDSELQERDWFRFRRFYFNQKAFDRALAWVREALSGAEGAMDDVGGRDWARGRAPFFLDEIGPLEESGGGLYPSLELLLSSAVDIVLTTRPTLLDWLTGLIQGVNGSATIRVVRLGES